MDLPAVWRDHQNATFPASCLGTALDGRPLVKVDAAAGALLTASLRVDGFPRRLDDLGRAELAAQAVAVRRILGEIDLDDAGRSYFARLGELIDAVLRG